MSVINLLKSSREKQFSSQIHPHLKNMYRQAYRLTNNPDDAEDLVQDVLIRLYQKEINLKEIDNPSSWLLRTTYNQFIDNMRKKNRLPIDSKETESNKILDSIQDNVESPHKIVENNSTTKSLQKAIKTLNPDQQALVALHDVEGYTLAELSEILETPVGTLKSRLHRARSSLRETLTKDNKFKEPFPSNQRFTG